MGGCGLWALGSLLCLSVLAEQSHVTRHVPMPTANPEGFKYAIKSTTSVTPQTGIHTDESFQAWNHQRKPQRVIVPPKPFRPTIPRQVFAHYMLITRPPNGDYTTDMQLAKGAGIDAFAINYGGVNVNFTLQEIYLAEFYAAAKANGLPCYLNFDTTSVKDPKMIVRLTNQYRNHPAQLKINNRIPISTFTPFAVSWDWQKDVLNHVSNALFLLGTISDNAAATFALPYDGAFTWIHPTKNVADEAATDDAFAARKAATGKIWMPAVASWFFKHFIPTEDWDQAQDDGIFIDRWFHLMDLAPDFIQILTWNDWGESHYIGPADITRQCGACTWARLDHTAFLKITKILIKAYKSGRGRGGQGGFRCLEVDRADEDVFFFYRTQPAKTNGYFDTLPLPLDANDLKDDVFVVSALNQSANIEVTTGTHTTKRAAPACLFKFSVPFALGAQSVRALRGGKAFVAKTGPNVVKQLPYYNGNVVAI